MVLQVIKYVVSCRLTDVVFWMDCKFLGQGFYGNASHVNVSLLGYSDLLRVVYRKYNHVVFWDEGNVIFW